MVLSSYRRKARTDGAFLFVLLIAAAASVRGQEPSWTLDGPAFSAKVEEIQAASAKVTAEKFAPATVLFERDSYVIGADGRVTYTHQMISRIETQAAVEGWSELSERWEPWYQKRPEIHARVIQPDGKVSELDQKTITDAPAKEEDDETYTDARIRKAPLPGVVAGAIIEENLVLEDKQPFFSGGGVYRDYLSRGVPVVRTELAIDAPKELSLQYKAHLLPQLKVTDEDQAGVRHLRLVQGYLPAHVDSDIDLSTHQLLSPMIEFSTGKSWAAVAAAYRQLSDGQIDPAKVKSLLPSGSQADRMATIQLIVSRLHKEVRYTGIEFGEAALQPQTATEVLKRHYGDCKDKAAMLVAMLRAAGIPANLALLDAGPGIDVTPELPGMNEFDHAIVYVPASGSDAALWIDATADYAQVGILPSMDQGREALIVAEGTESLTLTPRPGPEEDKLVETREFVMSEYGGAHIVESSQTHGDIDESYRSDFGAEDTREKKADLESYAKNQYLAKALTAVEHGEGHDFSKPFSLKLDMAEAKRGNTQIDDAAVAIPFSWIFGRLPAWFRTDPNPSGEKLTPQQEEDRKKAVLARVSDYDVHPFTTEWRYRIVPPVGFELRALPEDKTTQMGPAKFIQHYEADSNGVITAVLHFDTGKDPYTVENALAVREAVLASYKQDMIMLLFDQKGAKLLAAGKIREALDADRAVIDMHPKEALHRAQMATALLQAGLGDRARAEAVKATQMDAKSAVAFSTLGWVCQFNAIGVHFAHGFDWDCSSNAYKKAMELDPDDINTIVNLAILDEYGHDGERYAAGAPLTDAVKLYRTVLEKEKSTGEQYEDNLLFDLLYSRQYKEVLSELEKLPSSVVRDGMGITATVAMTPGDAGEKAGVARADRLAAGAQARSSALASSGSQLMYLSLYPEAAAMLSAAVEGQSNAATMTQQIALFRQLKPWKKEYLPASDPRAVVEHMFLSLMTGDLTARNAPELVSRHAYGTDEEWQQNLEKVTESVGMLQTIASKSGMQTNVLLDLIADNLKFSSEGDDKTGYKITVQSLGAEPQRLFVSKDDGSYKVVTDGKTPSEAGEEVLYLLHDGREAEARALLDWMREKLHRGGGDDPLAGPLLPRFWTAGDTGSPEAIQLAAISLIAATPTSAPVLKPLMPTLRSAWQKETSPEKRLDLAMLLGSALYNVQDGPALKEVSAEILAKYPDSYVAIGIAANADNLIKDWSNSNSMLEARLAKRPDDEILLRMKAHVAEAQGNWELSRATEQKVIDKGKATAYDYNGYAWSALFDGKVNADVEKAAQQANSLSKSASFAELHTLACIYAFEGKTSEARELLLQAMAASNISEPNSAVWFGFGSIYEKYGVNDAAIAAYRKVEKPAGPIGAGDTYVLAQARLKALGVQ